MTQTLEDLTRPAARGSVGVADVVVIGAGQAGLSAAFHLQRRGFVPAERAADDVPPGARTYVVLDGEDGPGGAWRHRWQSLRMSTVNGIHDLPGMTQPAVDPDEPAADALPRYFADYEVHLDLAVRRPVRVTAVRPADDAPDGPLLVETDADVPRTWRTRAVLNATGTWRKPFWPYYPGRETFLGRQLHTHDYVSADELAGQHVVVIGGGISAVQHLVEISAVTTTTWVTRREPVWRDGGFAPEEGRRAVAMVEERVRQGLPPRSVVSVTGLLRPPGYAAAAARGAFDRRPMFERIEPDGVRWSDGTFQRADVLYWATGFRADLDHLRPMSMRAPGGGIRMNGTQVDGEPRLHLLGYGPSASTIGANRAGRDAVQRLLSGVLAVSS